MQIRPHSWRGFPRRRVTTRRPQTPRMLRRRNQTLTLMAANGFLTPQRLAEVIRRPIPIIAAPRRGCSCPVGRWPCDRGTQIARYRERARGPAEWAARRVFDGRRPRAADRQRGARTRPGRACARHPRARGLVQGAVVVLGNGDGRVLAEAGGRRQVQQPGCVLRRFQPRHQLFASRDPR